MAPNDHPVTPSVMVNDENPSELIKLVEEKPPGSQAEYDFYISS